MASNPVDPLQTLQAALSVQANSQEQAGLLATLRVSLENHPAPIPILAQTLINIVVNSGDSLLKRWVIDLFHFAICRSSLSLDARTQMALKALDTLVQLLDDSQPAIVKVVIQCMTTVYPLVFRHLCINRNNPASWTTLSSSKARILEFVWAPHVNHGVKLSAMKFAQRVILVQTRGISDPRLLNKNDPSISSCPGEHPFISAAKLEAEGQKLLEGLTSILYTSQDVDLLSAMLNSWAALVKQRPSILPYLITALRTWTPAALTGLPASRIKSVEKAVRILLVHLSRLPASSPYHGQINEALGQQGIRMEKAAGEEKKRKTALVESRKRPSSNPSEPTENKRIKLENETTQASLITNLIVANLEAFTEPQLISLVDTYRQSRRLGVTMPAQLPPAIGPIAMPVPKPAASSPPIQNTSTPSIPTGPRNNIYDMDSTLTPPPQSMVLLPEAAIKDEPVDPLQMDIDEDEFEFEPERLNEELSTSPEAENDLMATGLDPGMIDFQNVDFTLPPPKDLTEKERLSLISTSITRIWSGAEELHVSGSSVLPESEQAGGNSASEMWMLLLVRMITRVAEPPWNDESMDDSSNGQVLEQDFFSRQDQLRQTLCDYVMADFPSRVRLATAWMNEEWYNDQIRLTTDRTWRPNYETWLNQLVASYQAVLDGKDKDKAFARFLLDLPSIPSDLLDLLRDLCIDSSSNDRAHVGFATLRGYVAQRPSMRTDALNVLLELTTHSDKRTRLAAINTVKAWVPHSQPMDGIVREFALQMLRKLQLRPRTQPIKDAATNGDLIALEENGLESGDSLSGEGDREGHDMEDGQLPPEDLVHTAYLPERIKLPAKKAQVLQHVELLFALSVKVPEFLDEIFTAYGNMDRTVQEAIQDLITALIRSLGPSHGKLLTLMRQCPPGSESLALRILTIFTEHGRASAQLVALVKALINERDLDARFLIPIIAEMDKTDIMRHLPRIVSSLNNQSETKNLVRSVFSSIVTTPPQTFGSVTSNLPRVRQSELLTPAELMVLLHESEKEIGLKSAMEAIAICFSMTDVFRSEILAVVMQQIMDEPVLPVLFLRTVIQAVTTYKSLVGFVSTTLLSRLITKKIWTNPPLWEGFIRCAKVIAPASFGALLQLPKDQLRELVDKQPSLKSGLRDYVTKKAPNKARVAGFLDIFGEPEDGNVAVQTPQPTDDIVTAVA
ncbi:hypothetical protein BYT27DRAFT_6817554 [Phlegmacium glaucopus]|nr:hypothetical protein BYT27DRAFT_6817554 [Phlegmacium glaucopus]